MLDNFFLWYEMQTYWHVNGRRTLWYRQFCLKRKKKQVHEEKRTVYGPSWPKFRDELIIPDVSVSPMPPCVVVTAPLPAGTVHQSMSRGGIVDPGVRNCLEESSVVGSRKLRKYVAVYFAVSKESCSTTGPYVSRPATCVPTCAEYKLLSLCWCENVEEEVTTPWLVLLETCSGDCRWQKVQAPN